MVRMMPWGMADTVRTLPACRQSRQACGPVCPSNGSSALHVWRRRYGVPVLTTLRYGVRSAACVPQMTAYSCRSFRQHWQYCWVPKTPGACTHSGAPNTMQGITTFPRLRTVHVDMASCDESMSRTHPCQAYELVRQLVEGWVHQVPLVFERVPQVWWLWRVVVLVALQHRACKAGQQTRKNVLQREQCIAWRSCSRCWHSYPAHRTKTELDVQREPCGQQQRNQCRGCVEYLLHHGRDDVRRHEGLVQLRLDVQRLVLRGLYSEERAVRQGLKLWSTGEPPGHRPSSETPSHQKAQRIGIIRSGAVGGAYPCTTQIHGPGCLHT